MPTLCGLFGRRTRRREDSPPRGRSRVAVHQGAEAVSACHSSAPLEPLVLILEQIRLIDMPATDQGHPDPRASMPVPAFSHHQRTQSVDLGRSVQVLDSLQDDAAGESSRNSDSIQPDPPGTPENADGGPATAENEMAELDTAEQRNAQPDTADLPTAGPALAKPGQPGATKPAAVEAAIAEPAAIRPAIATPVTIPPAALLATDEEATRNTLHPSGAVRSPATPTRSILKHSPSESLVLAGTVQHDVSVPGSPSSRRVSFSALPTWEGSTGRGLRGTRNRGGRGRGGRGRGSERETEDDEEIRTISFASTRRGAGASGRRGASH
jgi:hypothetical protein